MIDLQTHEVVFHADFDLVDEDGCLRVSSRFMQGRRPPEPGGYVYLIDGRRGCVAVVESVDGWYARVRPDWGTWTGSERLRRTG